MLTMNRATLVGHAGRNPEMRTLASGGELALFSLATNERFKRRDGTEGESTEWHAIVAFGSAAQTVRKLVRRGAAVLVEGRIATRTWTDKSGTEHRTSEILVAGPQARVNVLTKRSRGPGNDDEPSGGGAAAAAVPEGTDLAESAARRQADAGTGGDAVPAVAADATSDAEGDGTDQDSAAADRAASGGAVSEAATCARAATGAAVGETSVPAGTETEEVGAAAGAPASAGTSDAGGGEKAVPAGDAQATPGSECNGAGEMGGDGRAGEAMPGGEVAAKTEGGASSDGVGSPAGADASDGVADASTGGDAGDAVPAETATAQAESEAAGNDEAAPSGHEAGGTAVAGVEPDAASATGNAVRPDGADHG